MNNCTINKIKQKIRLHNILGREEAVHTCTPTSNVSIRTRTTYRKIKNASNCPGGQISQHNLISSITQRWSHLTITSERRQQQAHKAIVVMTALYQLHEVLFILIMVTTPICGLTQKLQFGNRDFTENIEFVKIKDSFKDNKCVEFLLLYSNQFLESKLQEFNGYKAQ